MPGHRRRFFMDTGTRRRRAILLGRVLLALFGAYATAALAAIAIARFLPMPRAESVMTGLLSSFLLYGLVVIRVCRTCSTETRLAACWRHRSRAKWRAAPRWLARYRGHVRKRGGSAVIVMAIWRSSEKS
jgi:hypothetical protein